MDPLRNEKLVEIKNLQMFFPVTRGILRRKIAEVKAVDNVSFEINRGKTLGIVGESGSGKTTTGRCVLRLYRPTGGQIFFEGQDITNLPERKLRPLRRKMSLVFQDPFGSLDPRQTAGSIVGEPLIIHSLAKSTTDYKRRVEELFYKVGLNPNMSNRFPHEFSGGQRQRIGVARAIASEASLIICDEPVSALDVSIQAQIINLLEELQEEFKLLTYIFIAHDLSIVKHISDRIAVMYLGHIVEMADCNTLYNNPKHPYTQALLSAIPIADPFLEEKRQRIFLKGEIPSPLSPPSGCVFHTRCPVALKDCEKLVPSLQEIGKGHIAACNLI
jgi:oligopeptide/dipeptide ABC transporter ATP-binding protein